MIDTHKKCLHCNNLITFGDKRKKFCNLSCSASYQNSKTPKRKADSNSCCKTCQKSFSLKKKPKGGFYQRDYCDSCLLLSRVENLTGATVDDLFENQTKGSLYKRRKNWQSANSSIRNHSRKIYYGSDKPKKCFFCNWNKCIEIAHLDQVKDFSDDSKLIDINSIDNLIATCPNHHWEFDNGDLNKLIATLGKNPEHVSISFMLTKDSPTPYFFDGIIYSIRRAPGIFRPYDRLPFQSIVYTTLLIDTKFKNFPLSESDSEHFTIQSIDGEIDKTLSGSIIKIIGPIVIVQLQ